MGYGVVDAQDPRVESVVEIEARIRLALEYFAPEQLWINPDCGLQAVPYESAVAKLENVMEATRRVRQIACVAVSAGTKGCRDKPSG